MTIMKIIIIAEGDRVEKGLLAGMLLNYIAYFEGYETVKFKIGTRLAFILSEMGLVEFKNVYPKPEEV